MFDCRTTTKALQRRQNDIGYNELYKLTVCCTAWRIRSCAGYLLLQQALAQHCSAASNSSTCASTRTQCAF
eukprot:4282-Heterococcus_DN1.PRE.1